MSKRYRAKFDMPCSISKGDVFEEDYQFYKNYGSQDCTFTTPKDYPHLFEEEVKEPSEEEKKIECLAIWIHKGHHIDREKDFVDVEWHKMDSSYDKYKKTKLKLAQKLFPYIKDIFYKENFKMVDNESDFIFPDIPKPKKSNFFYTMIDCSANLLNCAHENWLDVPKSLLSSNYKSASFCAKCNFAKIELINKSDKHT